MERESYGVSQKLSRIHIDIIAVRKGRKELLKSKYGAKRKVQKWYSVWKRKVAPPSRDRAVGSSAAS